jgi:hypothetical protein
MRRERRGATRRIRPPRRRRGAAPWEEGEAGRAPPDASFGRRGAASDDGDRTAP